MRCAQKGCALPPDATTTDGALCPVCGNPLIVVVDEVSHEQPPFVPVGEDGALLAVAVDSDARDEALQALHDESTALNNGVHWATGN